eukprot:1138976-Pelagomonas_calceolata.AAC.1
MLEPRIPICPLGCRWKEQKQKRRGNTSQKAVCLNDALSNKQAGKLQVAPATDSTLAAPARQG